MVTLVKTRGVSREDSEVLPTVAPESLSLRLTVLEHNAECRVCGGRVPKGAMANVLRGRELVHVGRCSRLVRAIARSLSESVLRPPSTA